MNIEGTLKLISKKLADDAMAKKGTGKQTNNSTQTQPRT